MAFPRSRVCRRASGSGAEPVRRPGPGPSGIQSRWTPKDENTHSKPPPRGWPGIRAAGRARMFPTHVGDALASKHGSGPENPWTLPSAIPGKPAHSGGWRLCPASGKWGLWGHVRGRAFAPPAALRLASLRRGMHSKEPTPASRPGSWRWGCGG